MNLRNIFIVVALTLPIAGCYEISGGARVGVVNKLSKRGYFCKTWEGEMILGGTRQHTTAVPDGNGGAKNISQTIANVWSFTVSDIRLIPALEAAMNSGQVVRLDYKQELVTFCRADSDDYFVTKVTVIE